MWVKPSELALAHADPQHVPVKCLEIHPQLSSMFTRSAEVHKSQIKPWYERDLQAARAQPTVTYFVEIAFKTPPRGRF